MLLEGKREIESALRWQGLDYAVKINLLTDEKSEADLDYERLREIFGDIVKRR